MHHCRPTTTACRRTSARPARIQLHSNYWYQTDSSLWPLAVDKHLDKSINKAAAFFISAKAIIRQYIGQTRRCLFNNSVSAHLGKTHIKHFKKQQSQPINAHSLITAHQRPARAGLSREYNTQAHCQLPLKSPDYWEDLSRHFVYVYI